MKTPVFIFAAVFGALIQGCAGQGIIKQTDVVRNLDAAETAQEVVKTPGTVAPEAGTKAVEKPAGVPENAVKPAGKKKFRMKQLVINSDNMNYNKETSEAVFRGHVTAEASNVLIKSDVLTSKDYKKSAQAKGNVRAFYKDQGVTIDCGRLDYKDELALVYAYDDVRAYKTLANGDTIVLNAEEMQFNAADNTLTAKKIKKRIRITMKDIIAFCDEVRYNDETRELFMTGNPLVKKSKSVMLAESITMNVDKKSMKLKQNIWTKLFYKDFETAQKEVKVETDKNAASDKNVQQKEGSK